MFFGGNLCFLYMQQPCQIASWQIFLRITIAYLIGADFACGHWFNFFYSIP